jgi:elongation factor G
MSRAEQRRHGAPTSPDQIRNVVLVGPSGSGKTTLFERLAAVDAAGRTTEPEPSTAVRVAAVEHGEVIINLIDTPGQPDFVGEVRAGLRAADAALFVVSAGDGVDDATRLLWRECDAVGMPRAVAVTKLEAARADYDVVVDDCQRVFGDAVALYFPLRDGERLTGVADVLARTVRDLADASADDHAESAEPRPPSEEEGDLIDERRSEVIESVIEESEDESLLERYLTGDDIRVEEVVDDLRLAIATAHFFPLVPTHAPVGLGTAELLRLFVRGFPAPDSAPMPAVSQPEGGSFGTDPSSRRSCGRRPTRTTASCPSFASSRERSAATTGCTCRVTSSTPSATRSRDTPTTTRTSGSDSCRLPSSTGRCRAAMPSPETSSS